MEYLVNFTTLPHVSFLNRFTPKAEWTHFRRRNGEFILYYLINGAMYLREEDEYVLKPEMFSFFSPALSMREHILRRATTILSISAI